ncbi:hypothetical protein [Streptomyces sp. NBC_00103]|uniref:hypothetical protein n=1 Tax=Streptomyces sp. NBC_00103 TaxID=2975653 RepID=UPI002250C4C3|nr:hypothetical protein [Streptomyces sp. NBC_00103]MCX5372151.1 hypothetical protein [Streptomyces sp. NBC_00103]
MHSSSSSSYGAGSLERNQDLQDVAMYPNGTTAVVARIYLDESTTSSYRSPVYTSSTSAGSGSRYAWASHGDQEIRMSKNDAEVKALDWAYEQLTQRGAAGRPYKAVVTLVGNTGTCNGCKVRQQALVDDLTILGIKTSVRPNYLYWDPASPGRGGETTYGYIRAEPRISAAGAALYPNSPTNQYQSYDHVSGGGIGYASPQNAIRAAASRTSAPGRTDPDTPQVTPSPPSSSPTLEQALRQAVLERQRAQNAVINCTMSRDSAARELERAKTDRLASYRRIHERLSKTINPMNRPLTNVQQSELSTRAVRENAAFDPPVTAAQQKVGKAESGLAAARTALTAAQRKVETLEAQQSAAASRPAVSHTAGTSTGVSRSRGGNRF